MAIRHWWRVAAAVGTAAVLLVLLASIDILQGNRYGQAAAGTAHVFLFASLAWLWKRNLPAAGQGWALWGGLTLFSATVEWLQPHLGRSAEWSDWLYGSVAVAFICGLRDGPRRARFDNVRYFSHFQKRQLSS